MSYTATDSALDALCASMERLEAVLTADAVARSNNRPRPMPFRQSAVADASGTALIVFEACPVGRLWEVRRLGVGGVTPTTTAQGVANAFNVAGFFPAPDTALPTTQWVDTFPSLPALHTYAGEGHIIVIAPREQLVVQVTGGTSGQQYVANVQIDDRPLN